MTHPKQESSEVILLASGISELEVMSLALLQTAATAVGAENPLDTNWDEILLAAEMLVSTDAEYQPVVAKIQHLHFFQEQIQIMLESYNENFSSPALGIIDQQDLLLMYLQVMPVLQSDHSLSRRITARGLTEPARRVNDHFQRLQVFLVNNVGRESDSKKSHKRSPIRKAADAWNKWVDTSFPSDEEATFRPGSRYGRFMSSKISSPRSRLFLRTFLLISCGALMLLGWSVAFGI